MALRKLILESDLASKGIVLSKAQRNRLIRLGKFPVPVPVSARKRAWVESEIDAYIDARISERGAAGKAA
jgi:prophage regulatory protein